MRHCAGNGFIVQAVGLIESSPKPKGPNAVNGNRYLTLWLSAIGLHALHQIEESIAFFSWYVQNADHIALWARIVTVERAETWAQHPGWFAAGSVAQIVAVSLVALLLRRRETLTRYALTIYVAGLAFFLIWHVVIAWQAQSYAPVMVTCIGGLYLIPHWLWRLAKG